MNTISTLCLIVPQQWEMKTQSHQGKYTEEMQLPRKSGKDTTDTIWFSYLWNQEQPFHVLSPT